MPPHCHQVYRLNCLHTQAFLEAKSLQAVMQSYDKSIPLLSPLIYVSKRPNELPIVVDAGASCSVTPNLKDFILPPAPPDTASMQGLNGQKTDVTSLGIASWDIEDARGARDVLRIAAYLVPQANIRLFSPQVHIQEQSKKGNND